MDAVALVEQRRRLIEIGFWVIYLSVNAVVASYSVLGDFSRNNIPLAGWEPFTWEFSSAAVTGLLIIAVAKFNQAYRFRSNNWKEMLAVHLAATVPFSLIHVGGMVGLRKLVYATMDRSYDFGPLATELPYEFRKDFVTYWFIVGILYLWQHIRFLNAAQPAVTEHPEAPISRLVARKRGREFIIKAEGIRWIEASGNYANLHLDDGVFPVRTSMADLEKRLDPDRFARVHRSVIVNLDEIAEIRPTDSGDYTILMRSGDELRFSRRYRSALKGRFDF